MAPPPPTPARLSSLSTKTLSQILELTRSVQENIPSPSLPTTISKSLSTLAVGIEALDQAGQYDELVQGLRQQYERLVGLVEGLGVHVEHLPKRKGKTGRLVDTGDDDEEEQADESGFALQPIASGARPPHVSITVPPDEMERDIEQMEEDEEEMRRANSEVMQMQRQMMDDQDDTLNSLSSAIARQHQLSLHISSELEMQEGLLEDTDAAIDRTTSNLRRAGGRLTSFSRRAKDTGSTGLIGLLIVVLLILIVLFKT